MLGKSLGVGQTDALNPSTRVMDQLAIAQRSVSAQQRLLQSLQRQRLGMQSCRHGPAHNSAGAGIGDERDVAEPGGDPHVSDVSNPQLVWQSGGELNPGFLETLVCSGFRGVITS